MSDPSLSGGKRARQGKCDQPDDSQETPHDTMDISREGWLNRQQPIMKFLVVQRHDNDKYNACVSTALCNCIQSPNAATQETLKLCSHKEGERTNIIIRDELAQPLPQLESAINFLVNNRYIRGAGAPGEDPYEMFYTTNNTSQYDFETSKPPFFFVISTITMGDNATDHILCCYYKCGHYYLMGGEKNSLVGFIEHPQDVFFTEGGQEALKAFIASPYKKGGGEASLDQWENGNKGDTQPKPFLLIPKAFYDECNASEYAWDTLTFEEIKDCLSVPVYQSSHVKTRLSVQVLNLQDESACKKYVTLINP